jgi:hypothetical protein
MPPRVQLAGLAISLSLIKGVGTDVGLQVTEAILFGACEGGLSDIQGLDRILKALGFTQVQYS